MGDISRRKFVTTVAGTGAALTIVPRHVLGHGIQAPSDTVNIAVVGFGMGASNAENVMSQNLVAFCDVHDSIMANAIARFQKLAAVDPNQSGAQRGGGSSQRREPTKAQLDANARRAAMNRPATAKRFVEQNLPKLQKYRDYRQMLEKQKDIDAVIIATPDHMHAPIAAMAMDLGKHVYVQKPLCWSVEEARVLARKAKEKKVVTQMGNQGHSTDDARSGYELVASGALGEIREVHVWTNRPLGYWPQGVPRPAAPDDPKRPTGWNGRAVDQRLAAALAGNYPIPNDLDWNLFLGGAPQVDYHPIYHPFNWRGWVDWGQGALGDMGAHLVDHPFWALNLGFPTTVETLSTPFNGASYPHATTTYYEFPARGKMPAVKLTWYDGGLLPPKAEELGDDRVNEGGGLMYVGTKARLVQDTYGALPRVYPKNSPVAKVNPPQKLPRIAHEEHEMNWVEVIKGVKGVEISSPFEYASPLTEVMLLGIVALRARTKIHYDGANMRITNSVASSDQPLEGEQLLRREYRQGFGLGDTKTL